MGASICPECAKRDARIAELERRLAEVEARLKTNSSNSSTPPSQNPLDALKPVTKKKSKRQRGGQPGHPPHVKQLLPPDRVARFEHFRPDACAKCRAALPVEAGPDDPPPQRFQTVELPPVVVEVVEFQAHTRTCPCCGEVNRTTIPAEIRAHSIGPRLTATFSYLTGNLGLSKRNVEEFSRDLLEADIAVGTVANLEREVSAALEPAHREAIEAVRRAEVKYADETSWKLRGKLCWLWAAATATVAVFAIHAKRSVLGLAALLGDEIHGLVHSDRYKVYLQIPAERRQLCWAHLKRDFQKIVDHDGPSKFVGRRGLRTVKKAFAAWHAFREGKVTRQQLKEQIEPLQRCLSNTLLKGALGDDARVAAFCEDLLVLEPALWTFVSTEGVEPTNNHMERLVRRAVLWRKRSFGCNSEVGCRFVERILTVVQTCRLHRRSPLEYLYQAVLHLRNGSPCPPLLANE